MLDRIGLKLAALQEQLPISKNHFRNDVFLNSSSGKSCKPTS